MTDELLDLDILNAEMPWIPRSTWYHWRATGQGPKSARLGRKVVYRRSDVDAWVAAAFEEISTAPAAATASSSTDAKRNDSSPPSQAAGRRATARVAAAPPFTPAQIDDLTARISVPGDGPK